MRPGDPGFGRTDELEGELRFPDAADTTKLCWPAQPGAASYRLARAEDATLTMGRTCAAPVTTTCSNDSESPAPGGVFFYRVHAESPFMGSWGMSSSGTEAAVDCGDGGRSRQDIGWTHPAR